jgi:lysophospholipase L1-like esterase
MMWEIGTVQMVDRTGKTINGGSGLLLGNGWLWPVALLLTAALSGAVFSGCVPDANAASKSTTKSTNKSTANSGRPAIPTVAENRRRHATVVSKTSGARIRTSSAPPISTVVTTVPTTLATPVPALPVVSAGNVASGWGVWSSVGAPVFGEGALRATFNEPGYFSVSQGPESFPAGQTALRVSMNPGSTPWIVELSNASGKGFGRVLLSFVDSSAGLTGIRTAIVPLGELNPSSQPFSRVYIFSDGVPGEAILSDLSFVTGGAGANAVAPNVAPSTILRSAPTTTSALSLANSSVPAAGQPGAAGVGSVTVARVTSGPCSRSGPWRIMPLGDSLTYGAADQGGYSDTYRKALWQLLRERGFSDIDFVGNRKDDDGTFDGDHNGWGGFTAGPDNNGISTVQTNLYAYIAAFIQQDFTLNEASGKDWVTFADPDIVLLNIGTNDGEGDPRAVERRLNGLVDIITKRAPTARVILSSLPPSGGFREISPYVGVAAQKIAKASNGRVFYADIRTRMILGDPDLASPPFQSSDWRGNGDETHFGPTGGRKFAVGWLPAVEAALRAPRCA